MIGVVDYQAGNLASVNNALQAIESDFLVSADPAQLAACEGIILPGVGAAPGAMASLHQCGLLKFLQSLKIPFLGICLGMQLLYEGSDEGNTKCLGIIPGRIRRFDAAAHRVPHMGWNEVEFYKGNRNYLYFAHSYYAPVSEFTTAICDCGIRFTAAIRKDNYLGVQFHPEKSAAAGLNLLREFVKQCKLSRR